MSGRARSGAIAFGIVCVIVAVGAPWPYTGIAALVGLGAIGTYLYTARRAGDRPKRPSSHIRLVAGSEDEVRFRHHAARQQTPTRFVDGYLLVRGDWLVFRAGGVERWLGGKDWAARLEEIDAVSIEPPLGEHVSLTYRMTSMRRRLLVRLDNGPEESFVVNGVGQVAARLKAERKVILNGVPDSHPKLEE